MIVGLDRTTPLAAAVWIVIGLSAYFLYARAHSKLKALAISQVR
jgi:hypothetical protein